MIFPPPEKTALVSTVFLKRCMPRQFLFLTLLLLASISSATTLNLDGTSNTRDLGGYLTRDGRIVKPGLIFRSDSLAHLSDSDLEILDSYNLAVVTDFRSNAEISQAPDRLPQQEPGIQYEIVDINNPALDIKTLREKIFSGQLSNQELTSLLSRSSYIKEPGLRHKWGQWLGSLASEARVPHLFHCTAGKDRTGFAAAILLLALGVPEHRVLSDFLLSNAALSESIETSIARIKALNPDTDERTLQKVMGVAPESLTDALDLMRAEYGSLDAFLSDGLLLDEKTRRQLQDLLLENPLETGARLTTLEIRTLFTDASDQAILHGSSATATNEWHKDGRFINNWQDSNRSGTVTGFWYAKNDQRCVEIETGPAELVATTRCGPIYRRHKWFFSVNPDGGIHAIHTLSPL